MVAARRLLRSPAFWYQMRQGSSWYRGSDASLALSALALTVERLRSVYESPVVVEPSGGGAACAAAFRHHLLTVGWLIMPPDNSATRPAV